MRLTETIAAYFGEHGEGIVAVYLFGSHALDRSKPGSDVDIAILFDSNDRGTIRTRTEDILLNLPRAVRREVHPVALNLAGEALLRQVFSNGKCLLVNDSRKLAEFRMLAYSRIAGFSHYRKKMQEGFIRRIMGGA
jgi:predicted nucleotidyltransferase